MRAQLTLAGERVDDLLLDTLLALGQTLVLYMHESQTSWSMNLQNSRIARQTLPTAMMDKRGDAVEEDREPAVGRAGFWDAGAAGDAHSTRQPCGNLAQWLEPYFASCVRFFPPLASGVRVRPLRAHVRNPHSRKVRAGMQGLHHPVCS